MLRVPKNPMSLGPSFCWMASSSCGVYKHVQIRMSVYEFACSCQLKAKHYYTLTKNDLANKKKKDAANDPHKWT
eukprot:1158862-Pelagomonas_calceolata.AAC.3